MAILTTSNIIQQTIFLENIDVLSSPNFEGVVY